MCVVCTKLENAHNNNDAPSDTQTRAIFECMHIRERVGERERLWKKPHRLN